MDFGRIIKRAWHITWRYKALWVLGIFAAEAGFSGGGNSSYGGSNRSDFPDVDRVWSQIQEYVPLLIGLGVLLFFVGVIWYVLAIAARGGLVTGVNAIEEDAPQPLGALWRAGLGRFWSLLGLDLLLSLPLAIIGLGMAALILVPVIGSLAANGEPGPEIFGPVCGSLLIGFPLLLIGGFILGIMRLIAQRYVMLGGQGAMTAARNSWRFFRVRLKDTFIMWLINLALGIVAGIVLAIPAVIIGVAVAVPLFAAIASEKWGVIVGVIAVATVLFSLVGVAYNAIWGTFASALWTLFFRDVSGMSHSAAVAPTPVAPTMPAAPASPFAPAPQPPVVPSAPGASQDAAPPAPPAWAPPPPPAPPIAGFEPASTPAPAPAPAPATDAPPSTDG